MVVVRLDRPEIEERAEMVDDVVSIEVLRVRMFSEDFREGRRGGCPRLAVLGGRSGGGCLGSGRRGGAIPPSPLGRLPTLGPWFS